VVHGRLTLKSIKIRMKRKNPSLRLEIKDWETAVVPVDVQSLRDFVRFKLTVAPELVQTSSPTSLISPAVDMWSVGYFLLSLFMKKSSQDISREFSEEGIIDGNGVVNYQSFGNKVSKILNDADLRRRFSSTSSTSSEVEPPVVSLIKELLTNDPDIRMSAEAALKHVWFIKGEDSQKAVTSVVETRKL
jgi:serine/threonine protein kinase